jgi:hypothetical protein
MDSINQLLNPVVVKVNPIPYHSGRWLLWRSTGRRVSSA